MIDPDVLRREAAEFAAQGYTFDDEYEVGVRAISAPIRNASGQVFAAISMPGSVTRIKGTHPLNYRRMYPLLDLRRRNCPFPKE